MSEKKLKIYLFLCYTGFDSIFFSILFMTGLDLSHKPCSYYMIIHYFLIKVSGVIFSQKLFTYFSPWRVLLMDLAVATIRPAMKRKTSLKMIMVT